LGVPLRKASGSGFPLQVRALITGLAGFPLQSVTRTSALCISVLCTMLGASAQFFKPYKFMDRELIQERGIKCMTVFTVRDTGNVRNQELCFNKDGRLVQSLSFWGRPVQTDSTLLSYDANGNEIEYAHIVWVSDSVAPTGEPFYERVRAHYRSIYKNGVMVRSEADVDGYRMTGDQYSILTYDTLGHLVEEVYHDTTKGTSHRTAYVNDNDGRVILRLTYDREGVLTAFEVTNYNTEGRKVSTQLVNTGKYSGYRYESRFYYDPSGKLVKEEQFSGGNQSPKSIQFAYNAEGLIVEVISPNLKEVIEYQYFEK
jgi:hypothetical protein